MGWNSTGKFGIHSGRTLRRYPSRKRALTNTGLKICGLPKRRNEFAVVKELKYGERAPIVDPKTVQFSFDDGGLPLERKAWEAWPSLIYSLNKRKRWLLPDMLKENLEQLFYEENKATLLDSKSKNKMKKSRKESEPKQVTKLRVSVVERHSAAEGLRHKPDCIGVTSNTPLNSSNPERTPSKKYSRVGDLKTKISGADTEDLEVCYEFLSPFPKGAWPANRQFRYYRRNSIDEVVGSKSKKKGKGKKNKCYLHGGQRDESVEGFHDSDSFDGYEDDVFQENGSERLNTEFTFPIGAYIRDAIEMKNNKNTEEFDLQSKDNSPTLSGPTVYGKGQAIYIDNDAEILNSGPCDIQENTQNSKENEPKPMSKDKKIRINLVTDAIASGNLSKEFGTNYIEGDVSPRKFIIKLNLNETLPNHDIDDFCLLFEVSDTSKNTAEAAVAFSLPKTGEIPNNLNSILESELNRVQSEGPLTVRTIVDFVIAKIVPQITSTPKRVTPKKSAMKVPVEFIQQVCKQELPEVCSLRKAVCYALGSEKRIGAACLVLSKSDNRDGDEKLFCEICYVEEDQVEPGIDCSNFTRLLNCSHQFCNGCWSLYIESCINAGQTPITCPHFNCKTTITEPLIWSCTNTEFYQKYGKVTLQNLISTNPQLRHCPAADCLQLAYIESLDEKQSNPLPVLCKCGLLWCFSCQNEAHWPASCKEMDAFSKEFKNREEYIKMLRRPGSVSSVHVKRCPICCHPIEKSIGCNHMVCRCGRDFCWDCLVPWQEHDWDLCWEKSQELEEVELAVGHGSARYEKYCKIALRNAVERNGKKFLAFKHSTERAKRVENAHKLVTNDPKTATCKFVCNYIEKDIASMLEKVFRFKNVGHFVLENTAAYVAIAKTTKMVKSLDRCMDVLDFIIQRCNEVLREAVLLFDEGRLETVQELLKRGEELIMNIDSLVKANRKTTKL